MKKSTPKRSLKKTKSTPKEKGAKSASPRKGELKRGVYIYSKLKDLLDKEEDRINLYASVLSCSAPYYVDSLKRYLCTMKLIDETLNPEEPAKGKKEFLSATVFANTKGNVPQPARIGTIVRIHRGQTKKFEKSFQLNCDVDIKAAWVLFDPNENYIPISHTGHKYTFIEDDKKRLKDIRKFTEKFFKSFDVTEASTVSPKSNEVDILCQLMNRKRKDKEEKVVLFDGKKFIKLVMHAGTYDKVAPGDVVYVRATKAKGDHYTLNDFSSILKVPKEYKSAADLIKKIEKEKKNKEFKDKLESYMHEAEKTVVASELLDSSVKKVSSLKDLFAMDLSKGKAKKFRVKVNVLEMGPKDPAAWIQPAEGKNKKPYYKLQLFVKDLSSDDSNVYVIFLCTVDGKGVEFFGKGKQSTKELKQIYKKLTKPWVQLDLVLEGVPAAGATPTFFIVDTKLAL